MKHAMLIAAAMLVTTALADNNQRLSEIRTMYAETQNLLKDLSENASINWNVKTTILHNEAAVGVVRYEVEYYPLHLLGAGEHQTDFVRAKRYVTTLPPISIEILYDGGNPAFYYMHDETYDDPQEFRIYWDNEGEMVEFLHHTIRNGKKEKEDYDALGIWSVSTNAYNYALQEYKRGSEGYDTDAMGCGAPAQVKTRSHEGLFRAVSQMYEAYFSPQSAFEPEMEGDLESEGLGRMYGFVTTEFNEAYCMCISKSISTDDLFADYDIWTNSQDFDCKGVSGITIKKYDEKKALVSVELTIGGEPNIVLLQLCYTEELDQWLVSDFIDPTDHSSYVASMKAYLEK